jgi:hypothetical protein
VIGLFSGLNRALGNLRQVQEPDPAPGAVLISLIASRFRICSPRRVAERSCSSPHPPTRPVASVIGYGGTCRSKLHTKTDAKNNGGRSSGERVGSVTRVRHQQLK